MDEQTKKNMMTGIVKPGGTRIERIIRITFVVLVISWILLLGAWGAKLIIISVNL